MPEVALSEKTNDEPSTETIKNQSYVDVINRMEQGIEELKAYVDRLHNMKNPSRGIHSSLWSRECNDEDKIPQDFYNTMLCSILKQASKEISKGSTTSININFEEAYKKFKTGKNNSTGRTKTPNAPP